MDRMGGEQLVNKVLVLLVIAAVAGAAFGGLWLLPLGDAYASSHSATRSFSATSVAPGETVTVTIEADNYGDLGRIVETLPSGFTSTDAVGQTVTIRLLAEGPLTRDYTVTATDSPGPHTFSGTIADETRDSRPVGGPTTVTITAPDPVSGEPTAVRTISPASVSPGGQFTVTIEADNYGDLGRIVETLPSGFTSTDAVGQTVTIRLLAEGPLTRDYTVMATDTPGDYTLSGTLQDEGRNNHPVTGSASVTVRDPSPPPPPPPPPPVTPPDRQGTVALSGADMPKVGAVLTATLSDPDAGVTGTAWQWSRSDTRDGTYTDIATAMSESYTPVDDDVDKYLKATASYTDTHRPNRTADAMTANAVAPTTTGSALGDHYDSAANGGNGDGRLDTPEMLSAVRDYFAQGSTITVLQMLELVRIYFAS